MLRCQPSSKVLFRIYTRNETFDNFPEEICRASRAFLLRSGTHLRVTALATLLKRPRSRRAPRNLFCSSQDILETQIMLERIPFALKNDEFDRPLSQDFNGHAYTYTVIGDIVSVFSFKQAHRVIMNKHSLSQIKYRPIKKSKTCQIYKKYSIATKRS